MVRNLTVQLDDDYGELFDAMMEESDYDGHGAVKQLTQDIIEEAAERRGVDPDVTDDDTDESDEEPLYNPYDYDSDYTVDRETLKDVLDEYDRPAIHPDHVTPEVLPKYVETKTDVVVAVKRYLKAKVGETGWTSSSDGQWTDAVNPVLGGADSRTKGQYKAEAHGRYKKEPIGQPDNIEPSDVLAIDSVDSWVKETREDILADGEEHPVALYETYRDQAVEIWQWVGDHEDVMECIDELDEAIKGAADDSSGSADETEDESETDETLDKVMEAEPKEYDDDDDEDAQKPREEDVEEGESPERKVAKRKAVERKRRGGE